MKFSTAFAALVLAAVAAEATNAHEHRAMKRHSRISRRGDDGSDKSCKRRHPASAAPTSTQLPSSAPPPPAPASTHSSAKAKASPKVAENKAVDVSGGSGGDGSCSNRAKSNKITVDSGPNGSMKWFNCGIEGGGWNPPDLNMGNLVTVDLQSARNTAFAPCTDDMIGKFYQYGDKYGVPAIMLASFAMQESSCNPSTVGGGGEQGLMQISREKCNGRSDADCRDLDFNIDAGAKYFSQQLKNNGGNLLATVGQYNGYFKGMTYNDATKARNSDCCLCQNNLDYLQQFFNGWLQGHSAYDATPKLGIYFNLKVCTGQ
ncbi:hypothetical protein OF83DRAFT_1168683 [Amylostereum chailletii]|nr:hypothetical protein OF83DRAFT_1168683 [Amylostereum chailletii]